jgi:hypothetical protein
MRLAGIYASYSILVADDISHDCLLGVDFLGANNFTIELGNGCLSSRANHASAPVFVKSCLTQNVVCCVSLAETVIVPARHEMVIPAKVSAPDKKARLNFSGIVEPNLKFQRQPDIALSRSVVRPQGNRILVRVVNTSPKPITLYKTSKVATIYPLR